MNLSATGGTSYSWSGPSSFSSTAQNPSFVANGAAGGAYTVTATDDNGCVNTATTEVIVNALPTISITGTSAVCQGDSFSLTALGGTSYAWKGAVGSNNGITSGRYTSNSATISRSINGPTQYHRIGEYTVIGTDANGCVNTASQTVSLSPILTLNTIPVLPPACVGSDFTINSIATITNVNRTNSIPYFALSAGNSNDITYAWSGINGYTSSSSNAFVSNASMDNNGAYNLTITGPGGCTKSSIANVTVNPLPSIELPETAAVCVGSDITLMGSSNGTILSWFRNGNPVGLGASYTITSADMSDAGSYTFRARNNSLCVVEKEIVLTVNPVPTFTGISTSPVCENSSATITLSGLLAETSGTATYTVGGGSTEYTATGLSDVNGDFNFQTIPLTMALNNVVIEVIKISVDGTLCESTFSGMTVMLQVNPNPTLGLITTSAVCSGNAATINLAGLLASTHGVATYTINNDPREYQASGTTDSAGNFSFQTDPLPAVANGSVIKITKIKVTATSCETNFTGKNVMLMVNPSPTLNNITAAPVTPGYKATIVLDGLVKNKSGVAYYTINNGTVQYPVSGLTTATGTFSFQTPMPLTLEQHNTLIKIVKITIDGSTCETIFTNKSVLLKVVSSSARDADPVIEKSDDVVMNSTPTFGSDDKAKMEIVLYPNPVSDVLNIETALDIQSVVFLNINGQKVLSSNQKQINVSALPAGIYMVQIQDTANNVTTKKIIIK